MSGLLIATEHDAAGVTLIAAGCVLSLVAYMAAVHRSHAQLDGTTELAALVVLALGVFAILGDPIVACSVGAVVVFLLGEKKRLHALVSRIDEQELEAALQFSVLALVVLPLLPTGPFGGLLDIRPQRVWEIVLVFSGLNFLGYIARRAVGVERGYGITGLLGGVLSSTAVTLQFSRHSRTAPTLGPALARGVIGACTVLFPRVVVLSAVINPQVAIALIPRLMIPTAIGVVLFVLVARTEREKTGMALQPHESPLRLAASIRMAIAFQVAMSVLAFVRRTWGTGGVYATAAALGFTDVDALTVSMTQTNTHLDVIAQAITIGILSNTVLKLILSVALGERQFRKLAALGLVAIALGCGVGLWLNASN